MMPLKVDIGGYKVMRGHAGVIGREVVNRESVNVVMMGSSTPASGEEVGMSWRKHRQFLIMDGGVHTNGSVNWQ